jgi:hypothetical protein
MKIFKIKIVRYIFYLWGSILLLFLLLANLLHTHPRDFSSRIDIYLRSCANEVADKLYDSNLRIDMHNIKTCDDERLKTIRKDKQFYFNYNIEILSSEILWSSDGQNFTINVSGHVRQKFFSFLWDKPIWVSIHDGQFIKGRSVQP